MSMVVVLACTFKTIYRAAYWFQCLLGATINELQNGNACKNQFALITSKITLLRILHTFNE